MRFAIIKNHVSSAAGVSNIIGYINYDGMTETLLESLVELDYTIELKSTRDSSWVPKLHQKSFEEQNGTSIS